MIIITIDGLNWDTANKYCKDIFENQNMKKIKNNVRLFTNTPDSGQPTLVGLTCLWSGEKIRNFDKNLFARVNPKYNENYKLSFKDKSGNDFDLIFNYFNKPKIQLSHHGGNPYSNNEKYFKYWTTLEPKVRICPSEEWCIIPELLKKDYDFFHIHTEIGKIGVLQHGPYEQGRMPACIPYDQIRQDKELKKEVYLFGLKRWIFIIKEYLSKMIDDTIIITADHGTSLEKIFKPEYIDDIPLIINRDVDLSNVTYQWELKNFIVDLNERYKE